jgi:phospholipase C
LLVALTSVAILSACGGSPGAAPNTLTARADASPSPESGTGDITHVVLIVQENRSFDNLFAKFPGADGATTGKMKSKVIKLRKAGLLEACDFGHLRKAYRADYNNGAMNGFWSEGQRPPCYGKAGRAPYQFVDPSQIAPYWAIAGEYVLADHMFQTTGDGSFTAHQDLIRGGTTIDEAKSESLVYVPDHSPWGCDAPAGTVTSLLVDTTKGPHLRYDKGPFPCTIDFPSSGAFYPTLRDLLDARGVSWKYYVPSIDTKGSGSLWNAFDMIYPVRYGPEWQSNISSPETNIFADISAGRLASVSWVVPDLQNSDHPNIGSDTGPSWVASVVNALGESSYWPSTAIVIVWDDWGGFYDHVKPPFFDNWGGLGFRVPMLIVSPYARETSPSQPGYISHTQYEFASILKFIEQTWNLGSLGTTDSRATSIGNAFDFTQPPRKFVAIPSSHSRAYFEHQRPSNQPVDTE